MVRTRQRKGKVRYGDEVWSSREKGKENEWTGRLEEEARLRKPLAGNPRKIEVKSVWCSRTSSEGIEICKLRCVSCRSVDGGRTGNPVGQRDNAKEVEKAAPLWKDKRYTVAERRERARWKKEKGFISYDRN